MDPVSMAERPGQDPGFDAERETLEPATDDPGTGMRTVVCGYVDADGNGCGHMVVVSTDEAAELQKAVHEADHPDHAGLMTVV